jgi:hypothetical protein
VAVAFSFAAFEGLGQALAEEVAGRWRILAQSPHGSAAEVLVEEEMFGPVGIVGGQDVDG